MLWGDGQGHFPTSTKVGPAAMWIRMGAAGDLDGDGRLDLAIIEERQRMALCCSIGGSGGLASWSRCRVRRARLMRWRLWI